MKMPRKLCNFMSGLAVVLVWSIVPQAASANNQDRGYAELANALNAARRVSSAVVSICDTGGVVAPAITGSRFNCVHMDGVTINAKMIAVEVKLGLAIVHRVINPIKRRKGFKGDCGRRSPYRNVGHYNSCYLLPHPEIIRIEQKQRNGSIWTHFVVANYAPKRDHLSITVRGGKRSNSAQRVSAAFTKYGFTVK